MIYKVQPNLHLTSFL